MDLRVYVDGIARIICDLTRTTTVHDIIIALAQYKGKAGRYSLIECAPDGTQRNLAANELTSELIHHPDWTYILRQNSSTSDAAHHQTRSKSLDGRKTPAQQPAIIEIPSAVTSSSSSSSTSGHVRTVHNNPNAFATLSSSSSSSIKSSEKKKRSHLRHVFPSANTNNNNNNNSINTHEYSPTTSFVIDQRRSSRTPIQIIEQDLGTLDNHQKHRRSRPKSALPSSTNETSAFRIVHNPNYQHTHLQDQQQHQYRALLNVLKAQELQVTQQQKDLYAQQKEIDRREKHLHQNDLEKEFHSLAEHDRRLSSEEYSTKDLDKELDYEKKLHSSYEHLQQQITRCSTTVEQNRQIHEQMQLNIDQTHADLEQMKTNLNKDKKDISQYQTDLERSHVTLNQQEDLVRVLVQRNEEIDRTIQQRRQQIDELENDLIKLDDLLINSLIHPSYQFRPNSSTSQQYHSLPSTNSALSLSAGTSTDTLTTVRFPFVNSTLWKLSPSGIWV